MTAAAWGVTVGVSADSVMVAVGVDLAVLVGVSTLVRGVARVVEGRAVESADFGAVAVRGRGAALARAESADFDAELAPDGVPRSSAWATGAANNATPKPVAAVPTWSHRNTGSSRARRPRPRPRPND
ncbi:hypothetical protein ACTXG7_22140 [Mycolicibacterium sp. Dal123E01]|uniref:hypothetical protein n=1 Tax=Mycolicibacterium sp. Dal123E01 TaxID=3457578 RepID=UPI00403E7FD9